MALTKVTGSGADGLTLSSTDVTVASGDLLFGTANKGVVLGVTSNTDGNTLDDYEEGTFTPTTSSSSYTVSDSSGTYTKVGRMVNLHLKMRFSAVNGSSNSAVTCNNLPFTKLSGNHHIGVGRETTTNGAIFVCQLSQNTNLLNMNSMDGIGSGSNEVFSTSKDYNFHITFET
tara:strand:- start:69 stop:587 length:519 start_codon:yes stop_codon:yes gene_type:complete